MDSSKKSIDLHKKYKGKLDVTSNTSIETKEHLSTIYSPGVASSL